MSESILQRPMKARWPYERQREARSEVEGADMVA